MAFQALFNRPRLNRILIQQGRQSPPVEYSKDSTGQAIVNLQSYSHTIKRPRDMAWWSWAEKAAAVAGISAAWIFWLRFAAFCGNWIKRPIRLPNDRFWGCYKPCDLHPFAVQHLVGLWPKCGKGVNGFSKLLWFGGFCLIGFGTFSFQRERHIPPQTDAALFF